MTVLFYRRGLGLEGELTGAFRPYAKQIRVIAVRDVILSEAEARILARRLVRFLDGPKKKK